MFVDLNPDSEKIIYSHFTCATGNVALTPSACPLDFVGGGSSAFVLYSNCVTPLVVIAGKYAPLSLQPINRLVFRVECVPADRHGEHQAGVLRRQRYNHANCLEGIQSGLGDGPRLLLELYQYGLFAVHTYNNKPLSCCVSIKVLSSLCMSPFTLPLYR